MDFEKHKSIQNIPETKISKAVLTKGKDDYELSEVEHELVSRYQPKFLAKGGEHIVYEIPDHPNIVIKVSTGPLVEIIEWNMQHGQAIDSLHEEFKPRLLEYLEKEFTRHQELTKYFGADHIPNQKEFLIKIPITEDILNTLYEEKPPAITDEVWGVVMVQRQVEALNDPNRIAILSGYAEYGKEAEDLNNQATEHLVFDKNPEEKIEKEKLFEMQTHGNLKDLLEKSENDENFKIILKELIEKIISYSNETGEILDLAGEDNVILSKKDDKWSYVLVDTQFSPESKMIKKAKSVLLKYSTDNEISEQEEHVLLNILCFVWTINGLAEQIGAEERINIIPENIKQKDINFMKLIN